MQIPFVNSKSWAWNKLVDWLIREAKKTPYSHIVSPSILHPNGTVLSAYDDAYRQYDIYMERYWLWGLDYDSWLMKWFGLSVRLHKIRRPDNDRHLHDHPWSFLSVILRGAYAENLPIYREKYYDEFNKGVEYYEYVERTVGSAVVRSTWDRHRISTISPGGVWTLFISGKKKQWWGFFVKLNDMVVKVYHSDYDRYLRSQGSTRPTESPKRSGVDFV
jgi:hypothetical protein